MLTELKPDQVGVNRYFCLALRNRKSERVLMSGKSPTHSAYSADTRLSRYLGSGRITGKPEADSTSCLPTNRTQPRDPLLKP